MSTAGATSRAALSSTTAWLVWAVAATFFVYSVFDAIVFAVFFESIQASLKLTPQALSVLSALFFATFAIAQLFAGTMFDRFRARFVIAIASGIAALGCGIFALSTGPIAAGVGRVVMGAGLAFAFVGAVFMCREWFPPERYAFMVGLSQMIANVLAAALAVVFAYVATGVSYRSVFVGTALAGTAIAILALFVVKNRSKSNRMSAPNDSDKRDVSVRARWGLVLLNRQVVLSGFYFGLFFGVLLTYADLWDIPYQQSYGNTLVRATTLNAMIPLGVAIGSVFAGWLSGRIGLLCLPARLFVAGALVTLCVVIFSPAMPASLAGFFNAMLGFFLGGSILGLAVSGGHCNPAAQGTAIGFVSTLGYAGAAILQPLVGARLSALETTTTEAFNEALIVLPIALAGALVVSLFMRDPVSLSRVQGTSP